MTENSQNSPICQGCYVNASFSFPTPTPGPFTLPDPVHSTSMTLFPCSHGLTNDEVEVLNDLVAAYNKFLRLDTKHTDDNDDFRRAIHDAQKCVAIRVARRVDPIIWFQPEK